jgi:hypothetical protein
MFKKSNEVCIQCYRYSSMHVSKKTYNLIQNRYSQTFKTKKDIHTNKLVRKILRAYDNRCSEKKLQARSNARAFH